MGDNNYEIACGDETLQMLLNTKFEKVDINHFDAINNLVYMNFALWCLHDGLFDNKNVEALYDKLVDSLDCMCKKQYNFNLHIMCDGFNYDGDAYLKSASHNRESVFIDLVGVS